MPSEQDYFFKRRQDRVYISRAFDNAGEMMRIVYSVFDKDTSFEFARVNAELVLRVSPGGRQQVKIFFYEDSRGVDHITLQRFNIRGDKPYEMSFTFRGDEIATLYNLLNFIRHVALPPEEGMRFSADVLREWEATNEEKLRYFSDNQELLKQVVENEITSSDVIALAYRRKQLEVFERLLQDAEYFDEIRKQWGKKGKEAVWQQFFEENSWIFGYGLNYVFTSGLDNHKLEQVTAGYSIQGAGKRVDALMKTQGYISSLCFVEIKTHETELLNHRKAYRDESWQISAELAGSVAQIQKTVQKTIEQLKNRLEATRDDGTPTGEIVHLYQPKSYVVIGRLSEFDTEHGINVQKYSSFELFRRNMTNPEVITFDELFERAKFIVQQRTESQVDTAKSVATKPKASKPVEVIEPKLPNYTSEQDLPFAFEEPNFVMPDVGDDEDIPF